MALRFTTLWVRESAAPILGIIGLLCVTACGGPGNSAIVDNRSAVSVNSPTPIAPVTTAEKALPATSPQIQPKNKPAANAPNSQIGSGGNDFFLFTKVRSALDSSADLKSANIAIEIKEGIVTLSGTVTNAEQKAKAEQLVREAESVKEVKNRLRIGK